MAVYDIGLSADGSDIDFTDKLVSGIDEYRQAVLLRLQNSVTFTDLDFGIDLSSELGDVGGASTLGLRASAAIMNDQRFTATLTEQTRSFVGDVESIALTFSVIVDATQETFSLDVLIAANEVRLVP